MNLNLTYVPNDEAALLKSEDIVRYSGNALEYKMYEDATIYIDRGGICRGGVDKFGDIIHNTMFHEFHERWESPKNISLDDFETKNEDVVFLGVLANVFGHAITDNLRKVWFLLSDYYVEIKRQNPNIKVVFAPLNESIKENTLKILKLANVQEDLVEIKKSTRFRSVIIPDNSMCWVGDNSTEGDAGGHRYWTNEFKNTVDTIIKNVSSIATEGNNPIYDKIYLSRTHLNKGNREFGEEDVERAFARHGYKVIHPQELSIEEQIWLCNNCKAFAATVGSISHLSVFCRNETKVYYLTKVKFAYDYQFMIDDLKQHNVTYINCNHTLAPAWQPWSGPFFLSQTKYLSKFFSEKHIDAYYVRPIYWKYLYHHYLPYAAKYTPVFIKKLLHKFIWTK